MPTNITQCANVIIGQLDIMLRHPGLDPRGSIDCIQEHVKMMGTMAADLAVKLSPEQRLDGINLYCGLADCVQQFLTTCTMHTPAMAYVSAMRSICMQFFTAEGLLKERRCDELYKAEL